MKLFIQTPILLTCILTLFLGSCTKVKTKDDENSIAGDSGNTNVTPWYSADSAKSSDSSENEAGSIKVDGGDVNTLTPNNADSGEPLDASTTDSKQTNLDTGTEEIQCDSNELLCDTSCVPNDKKNCGECGNDCTALAHVTGSVECEEGKCVLTSSSCESGWADCNEDSEDGCETNISEAENCGSCGNDCSDTAKPLCAPIEDDEGYECAADCPSDAPTLCDASCVNTENSPLHCGECDKECKTYPNSRPICEDSKCGFECNDNSHLECVDGCFPDDDKNCGECRNDCTDSGKVCDGDGNCVECLEDADCKSSSLKYCVDHICKECDPDREISCGVCKSCSDGVCTNFVDNTQDPAGCDGTCRACRGGSCGNAVRGTDPGNLCTATPSGAKNVTCVGDYCNSNGNCQTTGATTYYYDSDGDGYGVQSATFCGDEHEPNYVENGNDCDDDSALRYPGAEGYYDVPVHGSFDYNCSNREEVDPIGCGNGCRSTTSCATTPRCEIEWTSCPGACGSTVQAGVSKACYNLCDSGGYCLQRDVGEVKVKCH